MFFIVTAVITYLQQPARNKQKPAFYLIFGSFFDPEDRGSKFPRNISEIVLDYTASYART
jgi:hypothetical protein